MVGLPLGPGLRMEPYFAEEDLYVASGMVTASMNGLSSTAAPPRLERNLTVNAGQTAFMECRIRNLGAKKVGVFTVQ